MLISGPIALDKLPPLPWKNGGGITRTVAVEPPGAGMEDFLWRISIADLHASGSFSSFPGIDRTILLWSGAELALRSSSWPHRALVTASAPFLFSGEADVSYELSSAPSQDLNLMVLRGAVDATLKVSSDAIHEDADYDDLVVLCAEGALHLDASNQREYMLKSGHFLRISHPDSKARLTPIEDKTRFAYATIRRL